MGGQLGDPLVDPLEQAGSQMIDKHVEEAVEQLGVTSTTITMIGIIRTTARH
jgi:hypothetical protein